MKERIILLLTGAIMAGVIYLLGWSSFLTISKVSIETTDPKNVSLIAAELQTAGLEMRVGEPLARLNPRAIERTLKSQPWIGEVQFERNWITGQIDLFVREQIPQFIVRQSGREITKTVERFMTGEGVLFQLPGDLAREYQGLPQIELRNETSEVRIDATELFNRANERFPTLRLTVTEISTFITESEVSIPQLKEGGEIKSSQVTIKWGILDEMEAKMLVIEELLLLRANRQITEIDVSNPRLPIVR